MNWKKIDKFAEFVATRNNTNIIFSNDFKLIKIPQKKSLYSKLIDIIDIDKNKNEVVLELGSQIIILYNIVTTKITCIFLFDPEYVQSEYILTNPSKYISGYMRPIISQCTNPSNCLVIGLCLGNTPNALASIYGNKINRIDCVDINNLLCKFYKKFLSISDYIHVYSMTGMKFVKSTKRSYSFVCIDIPCKYITKKFMNLIHNITFKYSDRRIVLNIIGDEKECAHDQIINSFENFVIIKKKQIESNNIYVLK
jgi:hypothetical protein